MKFGIFILGSCPHGDHARAYDEFLEQSEYAEELGFDYVWLGEHHGSPYGTIPSPPVFASSIAQRTKRLRIGVAVTLLPFMHPVRIAEDWAMVDVLSGGRLDFGAGRGYQPKEFKMVGVDPEQSREIFAESLDIVLGLWTHGRFSYEGKHFHVDDVELFPKPIQKPPPTMLAALSPSGFKVVAEKDLQILTTPFLMPLDELKEQILVAARVMIDHGRDPANIDFPMNIAAHVAPTKEEAIEQTREPMDWLFDQAVSLTPGGRGDTASKGYEEYEKVMKGMGDRPQVEDLVASGNVLVTDPDGVREFLTQLRTDIGQKRVTFSLAHPGMDQELIRRSMRLLAEEVMPEFRDETPVPAAFLADAKST
jgi:alkanesulfonate monooxygenase SsuD/methylene tetrahydromethanopterin reductase-like flavin-dependent oxidoreductase (luciferase family)